MKKVIAIGAILIVALSSVGYADEVQSDTSRLVKVNKGAFKDTWVNPDVDLGKYSKVMLVDADFEFRDVKKTRRMSGSYYGSRNDFWVDDKARAGAQNTISKAFGDRIAQSFEIVEEAGPGVLVVHGSLSDIVSHVPPTMIGAGNSYISKVGAATVVIEARDSLSGEILFQASERSDIEPRGRRMMDANSVEVRSELRRWSQRVAGKLVKGLESAHS